MDDDGVPQEFSAGDVVRIKIYGKKAAENVVLQKDFPIYEHTDHAEIYLTSEDTKIGEVISKPTDYWYEVELNPDTNPQTIIGYDEDGAKIFKLFPEGADIESYEPEITPEDIPVVDEVLDLNSTRPVQNRVITRETARLSADVRKLDSSLSLVQEELAGITLKIYPVGSIYMSINATDPAVLFGGTWERLQDHFLLAAGERFAAGEMDGEALVILNEDQIPSHSHELRYSIAGEGLVAEAHTLVGVTHDTEVNALNTMFIHDGGGNQAHNNMPPYLAVYMWKRTA